MRLEKGYRVWGADITPETTPDEAGLEFAVRIDKPGGFIGRDALLRAREAGGPERRLRCLVLDDPLAVCLGNEPVRVGGDRSGRVTSGGYGHRVGAQHRLRLPARGGRARRPGGGGRVRRLGGARRWWPSRCTTRGSSASGDRPGRLRGPHFRVSLD